MEKPLPDLYEEIGGITVCRQISVLFHDRVAGDPVLKKIFPKNLDVLTERFALFLAEQVGGPADYTRTRGKPRLVCLHAPFPIGATEAVAWLDHMSAAMEEAGVSESVQERLTEYFTEIAGTVSDPFLPFYHLPLTELRVVLEENPGLATACDHGRSLLSHAAGRWDYPRVQLLLEMGSDVNVKDLLDYEPICRAAGAHIIGAEAEGRAVVKLLIQHGANVNARSGPGLLTPLHMVARRGTVSIAEALLNSGAEREARDSKGETPLRRAVNCGQTDMVRFLLYCGADPRTRDKQGKTPLDAARQEPIRDALRDATFQAEAAF